MIWFILALIWAPHSNEPGLPTDRNSSAPPLVVGWLD